MGQTTEGDYVTLVGLLIPLLRNRFVIARTMGAVGLVVVAFELVRPPTYTATASFMPQGRRTSLGLSGLAAQFGLPLPPDEPGQSPAFYAELLRSREILGAVVEAHYSIPSDTGVIVETLIESFRSSGRDESEKRESGIKRLRKAMTVAADQRTGVVELAVRTRSAPLAAQIATRVLDQLNAFNLNTRQSRARAEREFTENRLDEVKGDLRESEDRLQGFLQRNRDYRNSPELTFQEDRLARDVAMRQQLYTTLTEAYEQAKIDEVRDTPVITVIERPEIPPRPDSKMLLLKSLVALALGGVLGACVIVGREFLRPPEAGNSREFAEFVALRSESSNDLRHPLRALRVLLLGYSHR